MDPSLLARTSALGRLGFGVALMSRPIHVTLPWIGTVALRPGPQVLARALGARDFVLGAGTLTSSGREQQKWLLAALAADAADLIFTVSDQRLSRTGRTLVGLAAGGGVAMGAGALTGMRQRASVETVQQPAA